MAASIHDVARRAGVSISTVSRILNNSANVSEKKAEAVREAMEFYHYEPNQFGRGLVKQKSNMIGVYFPYQAYSIFEGTYNLELLKGIENVLSRNNYSLLLISEHPDYGSRINATPRFMEFIRQKRIDGLILSGITGKVMSEDLLGQIMDDEYPILYVGKRFHKTAMNVYAQYDCYMYQMLVELYEKGHRKVLFYTSMAHHHYLKGILNKARQNRKDLIVYSVEYPETDYSLEMIKNDIKKYIIKEGCTAIGTSILTEAQKILAVCGEMHIAVPEQIALLTVEHERGAGRLLYPQISAFYVPARDMGNGAAEMLLQRIQQGWVPEHSREYQVEYIERESIRSI